MANAMVITAAIAKGWTRGTAAGLRQRGTKARQQASITEPTPQSQRFGDLSTGQTRLDQRVAAPAYRPSTNHDAPPAPTTSARAAPRTPTPTRITAGAPGQGQQPEAESEHQRRRHDHLSTPPGVGQSRRWAAPEVSRCRRPP